MNTLFVNTSSHCYPIYIASSLTDILQTHLLRHIGRQVVVVTNETVAPLYLPTVQAALEGISSVDIILPDGETHKNTEVLNQIYSELLHRKIERKATLIALGGGVVGDMAGFAAATYQRGMPFIQIPTTLLSQVDSSVGGKTAVNHPLGKNMIGAFYQPQAVFAAQNVLQTLPEREFSAGMAEVIKYALLGDVDFLEWLEQHIDALMCQDTHLLAQAVERCCAMKAAIVAADEKEHGQRALLNLGHTFAHAIETQMGYGVWLHGEAVAAGMVLAAQLSETLGYLKAEDVMRICHILSRAKLPIDPPIFAYDQWLSHMSHDKKVADGQIRFVVIKQLGEAIIVDSLPMQALQNTLTKWLPENL